MIEAITINNRKIAVKGIGKMFYQDGFPIPMAVNMCKERGIEVSYLHLAKELLEEWQPKTVIAKLQGEFNDSISGDEKPDMDLLKRFCLLDEYQDRQDMIFEYLYGYSVNSIRDAISPVPADIKEAFLSASSRIS